MKDENNKKKAEDLFIEGLSKLKNKDFLNAKNIFLSASQLFLERTSILYNLALSLHLSLSLQKKSLPTSL